jgi:undecaprenyl-phosphate galactose phosphotransferase
MWVIPAVIIGNGKNATATYRALRNDRLLGYKVKAFLGGPAVASLDARITIGKDTIPVLPLGEDVFETLLRLGNPRVILALDTLAEAEAAFDQFYTLGNLVVVPPIRGIPMHGMEVSHFFGEEILLMRVRNNLDSAWARLVKRTADILLSSALLVLLSPLFALVAATILFEDGGPVFFVQRRIGRGGHEFAFLKFRSMIKEAEEVLRTWETTQPGLLNAYRNSNFKLEKDPRVSSTGKWIRRTSVDELPQLLNVIMGDMSLVGPRPLLTRELPNYGGAEIELYKQVRPGITGLWQVSGRSATSFADRARFDAWYVRNWSLWYDLVILAKTGRAVLSRAGAY